MVKQHNAKLTEIERAARDAIQATAKKVLRVSKALVPVDRGDLRKSGRVRVDGTTVTVSYSAPHAFLQHERLDYKHPGGGQAKYLESAVDQVGAEATIIAGVRARLN